MLASLHAGQPIAQSIPATEHSVMTSWPSEIAAIRNMIDKYAGDGTLCPRMHDMCTWSSPH